MADSLGLLWAEMRLDGDVSAGYTARLERFVVEQARQEIREQQARTLLAEFKLYYGLRTPLNDSEGSALLKRAKIVLGEEDTDAV